MFFSELIVIINFCFDSGALKASAYNTLRPKSNGSCDLFLRISEVCLSFSPHLNDSHENFNLGQRSTFPAQTNFLIPELCAGLEAHVQAEKMKAGRFKQMIF